MPRPSSVQPNRSAQPADLPEAVPLDAAATSVVMLVNRKAGSGSGLHLVQCAENLLRGAGLEVSLARGADQLAETVAATPAGGLRAVVAVGGDGTVGMALNHTPPGVPLAVLPLGTENLLAKYLKHKARPDRLLELLTRGVLVQLDAGRADGRLFTLMISVGFDAEVVRRVHEGRQGNITHLAYVKPVLQSLRTYRYPQVNVRWEGAEGNCGESHGRWVFGMNLPRYAQGLPIAPRAIGTDGLLDLCVFERGRLASAIWYLWHLFRRRHHKLPSVSMLHCRRAVLESSSPEPVPYQLDGDPGGFLPVEVTIEPKRMTCVVSPQVAQQLGFALP
ncbi:MAG: hypothetical protein KDA37_04775 [Planctomycetales bacterium]|nr:hypothetical protein [Planctomycetales bacterium]